MPAIITPQLVMMPAGPHHGPPQSGKRSNASLFFKYAGGQIHVVILPDGDQDHEQEQGDFPVQALVGISIGKRKERAL